MTYLGQNASGDFDQLSLHGVDFGENYTENYGITPTNLEGNYMNHYQQLGILPQGMGDADFGDHMGSDPDFGLMPQGMSGMSHHNQLGSYHQMGHSHHYQMGFMDQSVELPMIGQVKMLHLILGGAVAVVAGHYMGLYRLPLPLPQL